MFEAELSELEDLEDYEEEGEGEFESDELAAELLEVDSEEELEEFFGSLIKAASSFLKSSVGRSLVKGAKSLARRALPSVAARIGGAIGGSTGRALGGRLGRFAASRFEADDYEFEAAKRVVKTVCQAAKTAAKMQAHAPAPVVAKHALAKAAQKHKPTLPSKVATSGGSLSAHKLAMAGSLRGGRWVRRGRNIVVLGM